MKSKIYKNKVSCNPLVVLYHYKDRKIKRHRCLCFLRKGCFYEFYFVHKDKTTFLKYHVDNFEIISIFPYFDERTIYEK